MNCLYACMYECMYELFVCMNVLFVCMCVYVPGMVRSPDAAPLNLTIGDIYKDFSVNFSLPIVSNPISSNPVTTLEKENIRHTTRYNDVDLIGQATLADPVGVIFRSEETAPTIPIKPIVRLGPPLRMYIYVCMYVYMEVSMYVCMYVCMYFIYKDFIKCMYGMYVCMYVCSILSIEAPQYYQVSFEVQKHRASLFIDSSSSSGWYLWVRSARRSTTTTTATTTGRRRSRRG